MRRTTTTALATLLLSLAACQSVATQAPPPRPAAPDLPGGALLVGGPSLADPDIERLLAARVELPAEMRIALLQLGEPSLPAPYRPAGELATAVAPVERLRGLERVYDVSYLPSFLLPPAPHIDVVREAAARYQADWVLAYRVDTTSDGRFHLFSDDEADSVCVVECAVIDVRTGIVPFTSRARQRVRTEEVKGDLGLRATIARAELQAFEAAFAENVELLIGFLERLE